MAISITEVARIRTALPAKGPASLQGASGAVARWWSWWSVRVGVWDNPVEMGSPACDVGAWRMCAVFIGHQNQRPSSVAMAGVISAKPLRWQRRSVGGVINGATGSSRN
jgi:hypothetical protein